MNKTLDTIQDLRDRQLSWGLRAFSVTGFFLLLISFFRAFTFGGHALMALHILLYAVILCTTLLDRRLSFSFRAAVIVAVPFILGTAGLFTWGLAALGLQALFICCILSTMLFNVRAGIIAAVLSTVAIGIVGLLFGSGTLALDFDLNAYLTSYTAWIMATFAIAITSGLFVMALGTLNCRIEKLVKTLQDRNTEMSGIIRQLEREMAERARVEEERRKLEDRLQQARKMEALGTLAGGVAHDLNNILVGSVSYPDLLLTQLPEDSPLRKPIEIIKRSGVKAATIVQDLLTLARRGVTSVSVMNLNSIITDYFTSLEYQKLKSFHSQVEVELRLAENLPNILGSPIHLLKTIMNLVSNAAEAMPDGGKIVVSTGNERTEGSRAGVFGEIEAGDYVILTVSDKGVGILPDDIEKIFEPFYTKKVMGRSGTGLGMAVVWGAVKDHNGYIDVESAIGRGTTFTLYFPATAEKMIQPQHSASDRERMGRGESILIVDDVKEQREIAAEMLHELGYSVNTAASGEEAVAYLEKARADLLVLDMYMEPGMDGLDTYRKALKLRPRQRAIITSGYSETWRVKEAQKLGAGAYIRKPFFLNNIGVAIREELDK
jgi:signal transduction histidine kinase/ActR/RegA family two-component response regulator